MRPTILFVLTLVMITATPAVPRLGQSFETAKQSLVDDSIDELVSEGVEI